MNEIKIETIIQRCSDCPDCVTCKITEVGYWRCKNLGRAFDCKTETLQRIPDWCPRIEKNPCKNELQNRIDELEVELAEAKSLLFDLRKRKPFY